jgi:hypothetical protein
MTEPAAVPQPDAPDAPDTDPADPPPAWAAWASAVPDFGLSALFLLTWIAPGSAAAGGPRNLILIVLLEFIIIHSSAFMGIAAFKPGSRRTRAGALIGLGAFYSLFVGSFALVFKTPWPLVSFWGLTLNRLLGVVLGQAPKDSEASLLRKGWAATSLFYLGAVFLTTLAPIPRLGFSQEAVARMHLPGTGLWVEQPWRVMALGFLYYAAVGVSELSAHGWIRERDIPGAPGERRDPALAPGARSR